MKFAADGYARAQALEAARDTLCLRRSWRSCQPEFVVIERSERGQRGRDDTLNGTRTRCIKSIMPDRRSRTEAHRRQP